MQATFTRLTPRQLGRLIAQGLQAVEIDARDPGYMEVAKFLLDNSFYAANKPAGVTYIQFVKGGARYA